MASFEESLALLPSIKSADSEIDLAALVETYSSLLYRVAYSVLRSRSDAEDVVQESFLRVLQHRSTLVAIRDMRVWLTRIAWNLAIDRRRAARTAQMDETFAASLVATGLPADEALDKIRRMKTVLNEIERLPHAERHVLLLSSLEELNTSEIATVLGRSESAVRSLLFRARTRLQRRLEKGGSQ